jgi:hypothetical protein
MGKYYSTRLHNIIKPPVLYVISENARRESQHFQTEQADLANRISNSYAEITRLSVELLRYQDWH